VTGGTQAGDWKEWASVLKLSAMYHLQGIEKMAIERLLTLAAAAREWQDVLRVSTAWRLHGIREKAIQQLDRSSPDMAKLKLAMDCGVETWLRAGYVWLVQRSGAISEAEEEILGRTTTYKLFLLRHRRLQGFDGYSRSPAIDVIIGREFKEELEKANDGRNKYTIPSSSAQRNEGAEAAKDDLFYLSSTIFRVCRLELSETQQYADN
jgi:hypothetical protein